MLPRCPFFSTAFTSIDSVRRSGDVFVFVNDPLQRKARLCPALRPTDLPQAAQSDSAADPFSFRVHPYRRLFTLAIASFSILGSTVTQETKTS
ncbi:hypothetical protein PM082_017994 [Marasmius tenuissimus]|nr:hypothetical protein PM082_017994 [Marasmius tenuissimus]